MYENKQWSQWSWFTRLQSASRTQWDFPHFSSFFSPKTIHQSGGQLILANNNFSHLSTSCFLYSANKGKCCIINMVRNNARSHLLSATLFSRIYFNNLPKMEGVQISMYKNMSNLFNQFTPLCQSRLVQYQQGILTDYGNLMFTLFFYIKLLVLPLDTCVELSKYSIVLFTFLKALTSLRDC